MPTCNINVAAEDYADFIHHHNDLTLADLASSFNAGCIDYVNQEYLVAYMPLEGTLPITIQNYPYREIPKLYTLLDTSSMDASGIINTFNQPVLNYQGEGTIIGIIDTGIQYQNPLFQNDDGTTRILGIWDQTINEAPYGIPADTPENVILYGHEYTGDDINQALQADDPLSIVPSTDTDGHGTFMAGIAAGGVTPTEDFTGAAPKSNIAVVKLKPAKQYLRDYYLIREDAIAYQENDIMMAIKYLQLLASRQQMPITILLGLGTNSGNHDGTSPLGLTLDILGTYNGVICICAAGNETGYRHHFQGNMSPTDEAQQIEIRVGEDERGFVLEMWAQGPELYSIGFISPAGEQVLRVPNIAGNETVSSFLLENTTITVNYLYAEYGSGNQLIFMRFVNPVPGIWRIRVFNHLYINGRYHLWLPVHGFAQENTVFLEANPDTIITEPANALFPITVSAYNHDNNSIYIHSSRGYTRYNQIKPTLAAPGVNVTGPGLAIGNTYPMVQRTGTCVAAAHVAGAVASLLSWGIVHGNDDSINDATIRGYLTRGANRRPVYTYPNKEWGYGTLDLYQTFLQLRP